MLILKIANPCEHESSESSERERKLRAQRERERETQYSKPKRQPQLLVIKSNTVQCGSYVHRLLFNTSTPTADKSAFNNPLGLTNHFQSPAHPGQG